MKSVIYKIGGYEVRYYGERSVSVKLNGKEVLHTGFRADTPSYSNAVEWINLYESISQKPW